MSAPIVKFKKLYPDARLPTKGTAGAACYDLYSLEDCRLSPSNGRVIVGTGIAAELPPRHVGLVCSRSGLAANDGISVLNAPGVIDEDYRGEIKIILQLNAYDLWWPKPKACNFPAGSRLAQLMIMPVPLIYSVEVEEFSTTTDRADGGLGSTGV